MEIEDVKTFHQCVVCDEIFEEYRDLEVHNRIHVKMEKTDHVDNQREIQNSNVEIGYVENGKEDKPDRAVGLDGSKEDNSGQSKGGNPDQSKGGNPDQSKGGNPDQSKGGNPGDQSKGGNPDDQIKMLVKQETINEVEQIKGFRNFSSKTNHTKIYVERVETDLVKNRIHMKYVMTSASHQCTVCSDRFDEYLDLENHCKIHVKEECENSCSCKQYLAVQEQFEIHEKEEESAAHQFKECEISCKQYLDSGEQCNTNFDEANTQHQCTFCKENFKEFIDLQEHNCSKTDLNQLSPSDDVLMGGKIKKKSDWPCTICRKSFSWKCRLQKHMKHHAGDKPYKCDVCGKSFTLKANLGSHVKIHTRDQPFKCDVCCKSFSQKSNLRAHIKIHTGDKAFKCDVCSKSFTLKSNLQQHIRTHTRDQPFKCDVCGKSFSQKCSQKKHVKTHFKCSACRISFSSGDQLTKHMKIHTGEHWVKICPKYEANKN